MKADVSGQVHLALAVKHVGGLISMQRIVRAVLQAICIVVRVPLLATSEVLSLLLLRLSLQSGSRLLHKRIVLLTMPNGNILRRDAVVILVRLGVPGDAR